MNVDIIPTLKEVKAQKIYGKTVIVLDIFRCSSTIVTALANGCAEIIPAVTLQEAKSILEKKHQKNILVAGEIRGLKCKNFKNGNSPLEFQEPLVKDKIIILTTTNGTKAIKYCKPAKQVLIGSFLNVDAVCSRALGYQKDIIIVCAGSEGKIALEDVLAAGYHVSVLKKQMPEIRFAELAKTFYYLYLYFKSNLKQVLLSTRSGINLQNLGYIDDIYYCLQENKFRVVPIYKNNIIRLTQPIALHNDPQQ
ncbi:2-phosphosulfolactate phosphatase [Phosphitispora sp. TUW77]|uniref:2-phosphosulfolactate phosphatase n=1 Tax=Phosphitispora sp. TUW77 TaxID=3152361 RepID=UPI003AB5E844